MEIKNNNNFKVNIEKYTKNIYNWLNSLDYLLMDVNIWDKMLKEQNIIYFHLILYIYIVNKIMIGFNYQIMIFNN